MTNQKINKSDYTDSNNKVWGSIGENIRNGSKSYDSLKASFDNLDEYALQNFPLIPIKGHWEYVVDTVGKDLIHYFSKYSVDSSNSYAQLNCKIYSIILTNSDNSIPIESICLPFVNENTTYIVFIREASTSCTNEYLIYIGDE